MSEIKLGTGNTNIAEWTDEKKMEFARVIARYAPENCHYDAVRVCPVKDIECGDKPQNWCVECPRNFRNPS